MKVDRRRRAEFARAAQIIRQRERFLKEVWGMGDADLSCAVWRKSRRSNGAGGECVEVADLSDVVAVRDSKAPAAGHLEFTPDTWVAFLGQVQDGRFDLS